MALPKINNVPKYDVVIPSTKQAVRFRPYLVKEEKVLMLAMESHDQGQAMNAVVDTIESCIQDTIDKNKLTTLDVEYLFTRIRAKSVGETTKVGLKCSECETSNDAIIPIEAIQIEVPEIESKVAITDELTLSLRWPRYNDLLDLGQFESQTEMTFKMVSRCIEAVETPQERIDFRDESEEEIMEFIESLSGDQFSKIREFVEAMPTLKHELNYKCKSCGHENHMTLQGMNDFL